MSKTLRFKFIEDQKEAKDIWNLFSPHIKLDDEWEFRYTWVCEYNYPLHFIVGYLGDEPIGLLALQRNDNSGIGQKLLSAREPFLEFFGTVDTDDNRVILKKGFEIFEADFLEQIKEYAILTSLKTPVVFRGQESLHYLDRYELDVSKFPDFGAFLSRNMDGISRQRLTNRLNKISKTYEVKVVDAKNDLELLFKLNIGRFGSDSSFNMHERRNAYHNFLNVFDCDVFALELDGQKKAISYAIIFNKVYTSINIGYDLGIRDLQKLLVVTQMKRAMESGCKTFDAGQGDNGWKEHFHLTKIPQYSLVLHE